MVTCFYVWCCRFDMVYCFYVWCCRCDMVSCFFMYGVVGVTWYLVFCMVL